MAHPDAFAIQFNLTDRSYEYVDVEAIDFHDDNPHVIYWIHYDQQNQEEAERILKKLSLPSDVERLLCTRELLTQMLEKENSLTIQLHCLMRTKESLEEKVRATLLNIHLTKKYILTSSSGGVGHWQAVIENMPSSIHYAKTPCFVFFLMLELLISNYTELLYKYEVAAEDVDMNIHKDSYKRVTRLKKQIMRVKRHIIIVMNILMFTSGRKISVVSTHCQKSLLLLLNNTQTLVNESDSIREMLNSTLDQLENMLMREVNSTMKVLTAFASIFLPLTLIAGIYGMNFKWMPELSWKYGYAWAIFLMVLCSGLLYYLFKRKKWF